jgi:hypothetical protein
MNLMSKRKTFLTGLTVAVALVLLAADAFPQEQQKIFFKSSAANSKYLQQHVIPHLGPPQVTFATRNRSRLPGTAADAGTSRRVPEPHHF